MLTSLFAAGSRRADRTWPLDGERAATVLLYAEHFVALTAP